MRRTGEEMAEWEKATGEQLRELASLRRAVSRELTRLRRLLRDSPQENKDRHLAEIMRLSQVQIKLIPMEQALHRDRAELRKQAAPAEGVLSDEDWNMLEAAISRRRERAGGKAGADGAVSEHAGSKASGVD